MLFPFHTGYIRVHHYLSFGIDKLPVIKPFIRQDWQFLLEYYQWKYGKLIKPVQRRNGKSIPDDTVCPLCGAPHHYIYDNNGGNGQYQCKICGQTFSSGELVTTPVRLICPHCGNTLVAKKDRKFFRKWDIQSLVGSSFSRVC